MLATQKSFVTRALSRLGSENAFAILARAREIEATGRRVVHMEIGEPDFDTPDNIKRAAVDSLMAHDTHYTPSRWNCAKSSRTTRRAFANCRRRIRPRT